MQPIEVCWKLKIILYWFIKEGVNSELHESEKLRLGESGLDQNHQVCLHVRQMVKNKLRRFGNLDFFIFLTIYKSNLA